MSEWITVKEAAEMLGISDRSVRRRIDNGTLETKKQGRRRFVLIDKGEAAKADEERGPELLEQLRDENEYLRERVKELQQELNRTTERADEIIMKLIDCVSILIERAMTKR